MKKLSCLLVVSFFCIYNTLFSQNSPEFSNQVNMGLIKNPDIVEASGIVESRKNPHVFWVHNDRNNENRLFAFNSNGKNLAVYHLDGIVNRDWEDIAIGPGPSDGVDYIYIGDIGDNYSEYDLKYIYRIPEPDVHFMQEPVAKTLFGAETITCRYPDGVRDAETMMLDPLTKDLYIVSKRELNELRLYRAPYPQSTTEIIMMEHLATLNLTQFVGGDISSSGLEILIKNYETIYYWSRNASENIWDVLTEEPIIVPYVEENQGEAVCWASDSMGYYTVSEESGIESYLYFYPRINPSSVVINEIMSSPSVVAENLGEWFEIYNNGNETVDLEGWTIKDAKNDLHIISKSLLLNPGDFLILGSNSDFSTNGGVTVNYQYENFDLDNTDDEIIILSPLNEIVDEVCYDEGVVFPLMQGYSIFLMDPNMENNFGLHWKRSDLQFGDGDYGTPGYSNTPHVQSLSIHEIQYTEDPSGVAPLLNQIVTTSGIVTVDPKGFFDQWFFIQDSMDKWSGISVKKNSTPVEKGDSIKITGMVTELWENVTQISNVYDFQILKEGVFGISPVELTTGEIGQDGENAEAYEGMLIKVNGICDNDNLGWREWSINDGSGSVQIYSRYLDDFTPVLNMSYQVTGIQYQRSGNFQILPWSSNDVVTGFGKMDLNLPDSYKLFQNYTNPFNPSTIIKYDIPDESNVTLKVFDVLGREIATLVNKEQKAGYYEVEFEASNLSSGIYFYRIHVGGFVDTKKMLLLR